MVWEHPDGTRVTLRDGIHGHIVSNLATLEVLADHREEILLDFYRFFASGMSEVENEQFKAYVFPPGPDKGRLNDLMRLLKRHRIDVYRSPKSLSSERAQTYFNRNPRPMEFPAGSYVLPLRQPKKRLLKTLLEPDPRMEDKFRREVEAVRRRNRMLGPRSPKERLGFYDVTAWALPLAFGVEAAFTEESFQVSDSWRLEADPPRGGGLSGQQAGYAYLFGLESDAGARLAVNLLQEGFRVALATAPFRNSGHSYPKGTLMVRVQRNPAVVHARIAALSQGTDLRVDAVDTAWSEERISLGSRKIINLKAPRILVMTNKPTRAVAFGSVYTLLDQRHGIKFTAARPEYFSDIDLTRYNVMIFPDGSAAGYKRLLGGQGVRQLRSWIEGGGTFVGLKGGAEFTVLEEVQFTDIKVVSEVPDDEGAGGDATREVKSLPGSIFKAAVNNDYPLGFGYPDEIAVHLRGGRLFTVTRLGANVLTFPPAS